MSTAAAAAAPRSVGRGRGGRQIDQINCFFSYSYFLSHSLLYDARRYGPFPSLFIFFSLFIFIFVVAVVVGGIYVHRKINHPIFRSFLLA